MVQNTRAELQTAAVALWDRFLLSVDIPVAQHRALIGRGGQRLNRLQNDRQSLRFERDVWSGPSASSEGVV